MLSLAEVSAGVQNALAAYAHALDDGRTDDVLATFCDDASVDIPGMGTHEGRAALAAAYGKWTPRQPQRHVVTNTHISRWDDQEAEATSDLVFLLKGESGWVVQVVGRYYDVLHRDGDSWRFHSRRADFA